MMRPVVGCPLLAVSLLMPPAAAAEPPPATAMAVLPPRQRVEPVNRILRPGVTTTDDVAWYLRERLEGLGVPVWFMPYVDVQRAGAVFDGERVRYLAGRQTRWHLVR